MLKALGRLCCEVICPEMARLGCECPEPGFCYTIEHGGFELQDINIEYCEKVTINDARTPYGRPCECGYFA